MQENEHYKAETDFLKQEIAVVRSSSLISLLEILFTAKRTCREYKHHHYSSSKGTPSPTRK